MAFLSQALAWVRVVLFGPRVSGRHRRTTMSPGMPATLSRQPSQDVWGARLVAARRHRRVRPAPPAQAPWEHTGVLVRPYVARLGADIYATVQAGPSECEQWW